MKSELAQDYKSERAKKSSTILGAKPSLRRINTARGGEGVERIEEGVDEAIESIALEEVFDELNLKCKSYSQALEHL